MPCQLQRRFVWQNRLGEAMRNRRLCKGPLSLPVLVLTHHRLTVIGALLRSGLAVLLNEFALHALVLVGLRGRDRFANTENSGCSENQTGHE